jgi:signal transduction histidine kinase
MATGEESAVENRDRSDQGRLRLIMDRLPDGIAIVNREGVIRFVNPAAEHLFGRSRATLIGSDLGFPVVPGESAEVELMRPIGRSLTAELRIVDAEWEGEPAMIVSLRDVSDRKRAEERAAQLARERIARSEAEAANHAKSEFLTLMSHELRTPLNAVIGYSDLLDLGIGGTLSEEQHRQISRIRMSGQHLLGLVNEVLDLARVEAGRLTLHQGRGDAQQVMEAAVALVHPIAQSQGVALISDNCAETTVFEGDEDRVRQILVNLLNNAVKFTPRGGQVHLNCSVVKRAPADAKVTGSGPWICFAVEDTGSGIPPGKLGAIFDPFVQVETGHKRSKDGSGLGLTISRRLARLMNGDLTVTSELGRGSRFSVWLHQGRRADAGLPQWYADSPALASRLHGLGDVGKVLVRDLESLLNALIARLREEPLIDNASALRSCQLSNHLIDYVAVIATTLLAIEEVHGEASAEVTDATKIHAAIAECHGRQRGQLGWTSECLRREWLILREETERLLRLNGSDLLDGALTEALRLIERAVTQGFEISSRALERAAAEHAVALPVQPQPEG